jgi:hypothetical protein
MGINVLWDDSEKRIIRYDFDEQWAWEDFFAAKKQAYKMIDGFTHKVGVIMNAPPNVALPPNLLSHASSALRNKHPNTLIVVFVITKPFLRAMINTLGKVSRSIADSVTIVSTLDEARTVVKNRLGEVYNDDDVTLPDR